MATTSRARAARVDRLPVQVRNLDPVVVHDHQIAHARPRQMFLHTALEEGQQLLYDVETSHAITMCAHNIFDNVWVTSAADELGETVVGLLITEIGGVSLRINDQARPLIAGA